MDAALSSETSLAAAIAKLFTCSAETYSEYLASLFGLNVCAIVNDRHMDFDDIKAKFDELRAGPNMIFSILNLLRDGKNFGWNFLGESTLPDGKKEVVETFVFGELDGDGRIQYMNGWAAFS